MADEIKTVEKDIEKTETKKVEEESKPVETKKVDAIKNDALINIEKAKAIFEVMPHITTIWFNKKGEWRFYQTPDSTPIHKEKS
jgi:hypothetical protein